MHSDEIPFCGPGVESGLMTLTTRAHRDQAQIRSKDATMNCRRWIGRATLLFGVLLGCALLPAAHAADLLDAEDAFKFSAAISEDGTAVEARVDVAEGYYLYRERFAFAASDGVQLGVPKYPSGEIKFDETFNRELEIYRGSVVVKVPVEAASGAFTLTAGLQGCADQGVCYPPQKRMARLVIGQSPSELASAGTGMTSVPSLSATPSDADRVEAALQSRSLLIILPIFFVLGLLLSFTPCVLPMLPILSSVIVGQGNGYGLTKARGFTLALAYSLGMAAVYTSLGFGAALAGEGLTGSLQQPWVLSLFAALLVALALSMFGFYQLQLPSTWQTRLAQASGRMRGGKVGAVFAMGAISALLVGACVTAPLAGTLLYISQTRDVIVGGGALFALAAGMSIPLLLIGISAGSLLPRVGRWMESIKRLLGLVLIAVALWMISSVIPVWSQMLAWGALSVISAGYLRVFDTLPERASRWLRVRQGAGLMLLVLGAVQIVDALRPLASTVETSQVNSLAWENVDGIDQLDSALAAANGKPVVLDFYADWCISCREMERFTYTDPSVAARLAEFKLLRADVTTNSARAKALLKRFHLFGPPAAVFFDARGREVPGTRAIGFESASLFLVDLARVQDQ
jgi:thioredoxin:protein disulfide reductase